MNIVKPLKETKDRFNKQIIINRKFLEIFLNVVTLPSVYKLKNIKLTLVLMFLLINSLIVSSGIIYKIDSDLIQISIV